MATRDSMRLEKIEWHLLPLDLLEPVVQVLMYGRNRNGAWNWATPPYFARHHITDSLVRHCIAYTAKGEMADPESGLPHLAHLICNALFALYYDKHSLWTASEEDRLVPPVSTPPAETTPSVPPDREEPIPLPGPQTLGGDEEFQRRRQEIIAQISEVFNQKTRTVEVHPPMEGGDWYDPYPAA